jgi:tRNA A-37 threonylcarbamoyl transferase component Bud32
MNIIINSDYQSFCFDIEKLPARFEHEGETVYKDRNILKKYSINDRDLIVKSFKIPRFINRIVYVFFRSSKAERSYRNALKLIDKGIYTPAPVAYIEEKEKGLLSRSFYVSLYAPCPGLLRELHGRPLEEVKDLAEAFAHFTADIHDRQVLHFDYSPGNILYEKKDEQYHFCLVDVNRASIDKKIDEKTAAFNLRKLWGKTEVILFIAGIYARDRGFDEKKFKNRVLLYRRKFWTRFVKKHPDRKYLIED